MPRSRHDVEQALKAVGFVQAPGDHRYFVYHGLDGKATSVRTKVSHGDREIHDGLLSTMARQCKLSNREFANLLDGKLSQEDYEAGLVADGHIGTPPPSPPPA